jgi:hypothetical protein
MSMMTVCVHEAHQETQTDLSWGLSVLGSNRSQLMVSVTNGDALKPVAHPSKEGLLVLPMDDQGSRAESML